MYSQATKNFGLPQWMYGDHPDFSADMNPAYKTIDSVMEENKETANNAFEIVQTLQPIVADNTKNISTNSDKISAQEIRLQNAEHNIRDNAQNIAQNAANITTNKNAIHDIHETIAQNGEYFYLLLNVEKFRHLLRGTCAIGDAVVNVMANVVKDHAEVSIKLPAETFPAGISNYEIQWGEGLTNFAITTQYVVPLIGDNVNCVVMLGNTGLTVYNAGEALTLDSEYAITAFVAVTCSEWESTVSALETIPPKQ